MADKITKRRVDAAKPGETIWDGELKGFGLRVTKAGTKSYVLKYRRGGVQRWLTIGKHGSPWTPEAARKEALKLVGEVVTGQDPALQKQQDRKNEIFEAFASRYMQEYSQKHKKPLSVEAEQGHLKRHILPALGKLKVADIQRHEVARLIQSLSKTPYTANRCRALLSHMFGKAEAWGVRPDNSNPCLHVEKFKEKARERFLSAEEMITLGKALRDSESAGESVYVTNAIRLLLFTGARLREILTLKWEYVDIEAQLLRLPDSKTGAKTIPLTSPAVALLNDLPRQADNPYVICGKVQGAHLVNLQKPWRRIRASAGLEGVRIHDLRHSFASVAVAGGMSLPLIGSLLGHSQPQTTARYAHLADDPRLAAADAVAEKIAANMAGESAEIIRLKKG